MGFDIEEWWRNARRKSAEIADGGQFGDYHTTTDNGIPLANNKIGREIIVGGDTRFGDQRAVYAGMGNAGTASDVPIAVNPGASVPT